MTRLKLRASRFAFALALASPLAATATARADENGRLPRSSLAPIYHPSDRLVLEKHAAAAWNTLRLSMRTRGGEIYPSGPISAYRTYAEQVQAKAIYGANAATPGTSNHGWGLAVDLATTEMRARLDRDGARFGWAKRWSDASWEWWHIKFDAGHWRARPDPGVSTTRPFLARGSGGPGQAPFVATVQRLLGRHGFAVAPSGDFDEATERALVSFQRASGIASTGDVTPGTWTKLRGPVKRAATPATTNASAPTPTAKTARAPSKPKPQPPAHREGPVYVARGTAYYPANDALEGGFTDRRGNRLHTLQDFLAGRASFVSCAMDPNAFRYGQRLRIPELEKKYRRSIDFRVVDTGGAFIGRGTSRIDICVANLRDSYDATINGTLHLIVVE